MGTGVVSSGTSTTTFLCNTPGRTVGIGSGAGSLSIANNATDRHPFLKKFMILVYAPRKKPKQAS